MVVIQGQLRFILPSLTNYVSAGTKVLVATDTRAGLTIDPGENAAWSSLARTARSPQAVRRSSSATGAGRLAGVAQRSSWG